MPSGMAVRIRPGWRPLRSGSWTAGTALTPTHTWHRARKPRCQGRAMFSHGSPRFLPVTVRVRAPLAWRPSDKKYRRLRNSQCLPGWKYELPYREALFLSMITHRYRMQSGHPRRKPPPLSENQATRSSLGCGAVYYRLKTPSLPGCGQKRRRFVIPRS